MYEKYIVPEPAALILFGQKHISFPDFQRKGLLEIYPFLHKFFDSEEF